jgi:ketol-acid reductoisomerase
VSAELVKERLVQITNFLRSWQEVYTTIHFQGEERFVGSVSDPAEVSDHAALATLLKKQKTKLEEEQLQKMKNDQSIKTAVGLFGTPLVPY